MRKYLSFAVLLSSVVFLAGCGFEVFEDAQRYHEDFHYSYTVTPGARLSVSNFNGSIEIFADGGDKVDISGTKNASTESLLKALRVDVSATPDTVRIESLRPSGYWGNMGVRYTIRVPRQTRLDRIQSTNGGVRAEGVELPATLRTTNGSINGRNIGAPVEAQTTNGSINLREVKGPVTARTTNGHIDADGVSGGFSGSTTNGHIELSASALPSSGVEARTTNGSITLHLAPSVNANVNASTSHGKVDSDFSVRPESSDRHHLEGSIGSGGPSLRLRTTNGSIRILKM